MARQRGWRPFTPTRRQLEVLVLLSRGHPDKDIAVALGISVRTAEWHVANVLRMIGRSRLALLMETPGPLGRRLAVDVARIKPVPDE